MSQVKLNELLKLPLDKLIDKANRCRKRYIGNKIELCSIINAKSGLCREDCKFCAQSVHHNTAVKRYPLVEKTRILLAAREAVNNGAKNFGIVTSGNKLTESELGTILAAIKEIKATTDISLCASLGALSPKDLYKLKQAGLKRYHHNIETSERFYPRIVSTHSYSERIKTIHSAKKAGLEVCSGGIIGLGENWQDRYSMALLLKKLKVDSVPINFLVPIKGTPLDSMESVSPIDAIRTIAMFRLVLKNKTIKIAAGREAVLKDFCAMGYMAGANSMMIGGYLTTGSRPIEEDKHFIEAIKRIWKQK